MPADRKLYALTIRFPPLEMSLLEALARKENVSTADVVRRCLLGAGRELLNESEWVEVVEKAGVGEEWRAWRPGWREKAAPEQEGQLALVMRRIEALQSKVDALVQANDSAVPEPRKPKERSRGRKR